MSSLANVVCHAMEYYSMIKRNEVSIHDIAWMDLEKLMQSGKG